MNHIKIIIQVIEHNGYIIQRISFPADKSDHISITIVLKERVLVYVKLQTYHRIQLYNNGIKY